MNFPTISPSRRLNAKVEGLYLASAVHNADAQGFVSSKVAALDLGFEGIAGERHHGFTRPADARVPWYKRGTPIRNVRHVSLLSVEELVEIAELMGLPAVLPEWLGANIVVSGVPRLAFLPTGSRLFFAGGAVLAAEGYNAPCSISGTAVAAGSGKGSKLDFVKPATRRRGIVASVEHPGLIEANTQIEIVIPDQWVF